MSTPPSGFGDPRAFDVVGLRRPLASDLYHALRTASWRALLGSIVALWLGLNAVFAALYLAGGDCIVGARPGSFADAFVFSVQTMATIGYGGLAPATPWADALVIAEAVVGMLSTALVTGVIFSKFATPTARVLFSESAVICDHDGQRTLMLRVANQRASNLVEATVRCTLTFDTVTAEGRSFRRLVDLDLVRSSTPIFTVSWTVMHPIDERSPLHGCDSGWLHDAGAMLIVSLRGTDEGLVQTVHARHVYPWTRIRAGHRFADILSRNERGRLQIDYRAFHETEAVDG